MFCAFIRPRYQVSVYRTIGPLVSHIFWPVQNAMTRTSAQSTRLHFRFFVLFTFHAKFTGFS